MTGSQSDHEKRPGTKNDPPDDGVSQKEVQQDDAESLDPSEDDHRADSELASDDPGQTASTSNTQLSSNDATAITKKDVKLLAMGTAASIAGTELWQAAKARLPSVIDHLRSELGELVGSEIRVEPTAPGVNPRERWQLIEFTKPILDTVLLEFSLPDILVGRYNLGQVVGTFILKGSWIADPRPFMNPSVAKIRDEYLADPIFTNDFLTDEVIASYRFYKDFPPLSKPSPATTEIAQRFGVSTQILLLSLGAFDWLRSPRSPEYIEYILKKKWEPIDT